MPHDKILESFGLDPAQFEVQRIPSGHIHSTYKLVGKSSYILQRVNKNVFKRPDIIARNLRIAADYLKKHHPDYLFLSSIPTLAKEEMSVDTEGYPWRLFRFIDNSETIDRVESEEEAFSAAAEFGRLTCNLEGIDTGLFQPTIPRFHDLSWRYEQFEESLQRATPQRLNDAQQAIASCKKYRPLVDQYQDLIQSGTLQTRITHNDTKINNILLDANSRKAICVIDLDTLMAGYFIYDLGDMIRTFVSPANEEEKDLSKVMFRKSIYDALIRGYESSMGGILTRSEKELFPFAGKMMTFIMALRMLADYLNGDIYYQIHYPEQNHVRAKNQLRLLDVFSVSFPV